jgi:LmbE family N-acetylglucosaminyl deacetylase
MKAKAYRLLVVAHPDDETIFFGGLLQHERSLPWKVVCVTDGNADKRGAERAEEFLAATKLLGVKATEHWNFPDLFPNRLPVKEITDRLSTFLQPKEVYTHGPLGEYGHPHHQDVCLAVHRAFPKLKIFSPAWNCPAEKVVKLSPAEYRKKTKAFAEIYKKETASFMNILPNSAVENFARFRQKEVEALVGFTRREKELDAKAVKLLHWATPALPEMRDKLEVRLF